MADSRKISEEELAEYGIKPSHKEMLDGEGGVTEVRSRLDSESGTTSLTKVLKSHWQKSHMHGYTVETYMVLAGWIAYVTFNEHGPIVHILKPGKSVTSMPGDLHAVYAPEGALFCATKAFLPGYEKPDQNFDSMFDTLLSVIGEDQIHALAASQ